MGRRSSWTTTPRSPSGTRSTPTWTRSRAWRTFLLDRRIRQPFKQAFREIYILTPAEVETGTYSNRFAAHILDYPVSPGADDRATLGFELPRARMTAATRASPSATSRRMRSGPSSCHFAVEEDAGQWSPVLRCSTDQVEFVGTGDRTGSASALRRRPADRVLRGDARRRPVRRRSARSAPTRTGRTAARTATSPTVLAGDRLRRPDGVGREPARDPGLDDPAARDRRPPDARRPLPRRPRRPADLQDPPRLGQHPHGAERPVPVHRPERGARTPTPSSCRSTGRPRCRSSCRRRSSWPRTRRSRTR